MDALWAVLGEDSLSEIQGVLLPALREAVPSLDAQAAVDALYGAFAKHYQSDQPSDAELLQRIGDVEGDALVNLVRGHGGGQPDHRPRRRTLPPGSMVVFSPYILHRRPDLYPHPARFDPAGSPPSQQKWSWAEAGRRRRW